MGVGRLCELDYLERDPAVDAKRVRIKGVSRFVKAALVTVAFVPRFAGALGSSKGGCSRSLRMSRGLYVCDSQPRSNPRAASPAMNSIICRYSLALIALVSAGFTEFTYAGSVAEAWKRQHPGPANGSSAVVDSAGNVLFVATVLVGNYFEGYAAKYSATTGAIVWEKSLKAPGAIDTVAGGVAVDTAGNALVAGWVNISNSSAFYTVKLAASDGALIWDHLNSGADHVHEASTAIAADAAGNVIVAGYSKSSTGGLDAYAVKYAAADGAIVWEHRFDGATHQTDRLFAVTADSTGNVAVTGDTFSGTQFDLYVGRYAAADGALIWEKVYAAPTGGDDNGISIATDAAGNVAIAAQVELDIDDGPTSTYTAKYAAADGALLWERPHIAPHGKDSSASAVAVDAGGNVIMTGCTTLANRTDIDFYTAKYASNDGAILWEKTYDGTGHGHDQAFDVALDSTGNAIVTGESANASDPSNPDFYTIKYASSDGAVLWAQRFNGPDDLDDRIGINLGRGKVQATPDGGAVITGLTFTSATTQDAITIKYLPDDVTQAPSLISPASGSFNKSPVTISYTLPEAALPGSVKLSFNDTIETRTLIVAASGESAGAHTFAFEPANPLQSGAFASGPALPDRYYSITLSYQDASGYPVSSSTSTGVTIDTVAPTVLLPRITTVHTADPNGAALAFKFITNDLFDSTPTIVASPPSGSVFPVGVSQVTVTVTDRSGNVTTTGFAVVIVLVTDLPKPVTTILAIKGGRVPAAPEQGIPARSKWLNFGVPSLHNEGTFIGFSATIRTPAGTLTGVFDGPPTAPVLLLKKGGPVPSDETGKVLEGITIATYREPVFPSLNDAYACAVVAKLAGSGVNLANDSAILLAGGGDSLRMITREGGLAPNFPWGDKMAPVGRFKTFTSVAMPGNSNAVWFTATLEHTGGITSANDSGLWISTGTGTWMVFRKGEDIYPYRMQKVTSFRVIDEVPGSPGHGRYGMNFVGAQVSLDDGSYAAFNIFVDGGIENDLSTGPPPNPTGPWPIKFGIPDWRQNDTVPAALSVILEGPGVTSANNAAIMDYPDMIARKGSPTGLPDGSVFKEFKDPVTALDQDHFPVDAFPATLSGISTTGANDASLWWWHGGAPALSLLAREGSAAPGGGRWKSFISLTSIARRGPAFTATLAIDGAAITPANDKGLWAINSAGGLRRLVREGDVINGRTLLTFNVLGVVNGSAGQRRAWSESGDPALAWRAFFTDGTTAIVTTTVP
jgi:hypothetical protein